MSKARELAELGAVYDSGALSNRNLFINSGMEVAQRGTTNGPNTTNGVLVLDRWYVNASGASKTLSQESFTIGQTDVPGSPKNYLRLAVATGNDNCGIHQRIEDVTLLGGKTLNLSFWAKGTNPAGGSFVSSWIQNFGSGGSATVETEAKSGIVLTSSWQKFSFSITLPSVSGKTVGAGSFTWVEILRQPGTDSGTSAWTADIALPQVELGTEATPFEHRSYGDELQRCKRYFIKYGSDGLQAYVPVSEMGSTQDNYRTRVQYLFSPEMRAAPAVSYSTLQVNNRGLNSSHSVTRVALAGSEYSRTAISMFFETAVVSGQTTGQPCFARVDNSNNGYLYIDAEL